MPIRDYSQTAASNTAISSINIGEGCPPSNINDAIRQALADIRELQASATIASAATVNIGAANAEYLSVTGTTTITAFDNVAAGVHRVLQFAGALTLTHNGTSLILPTAASITTAAGDVAGFRSLGSGNWRCEWYQRASGAALVTSGGTVTQVSTGSGLTGGPITSSGTLALDVNGLSEDTTPDPQSDTVATYDDSAAANKKVKSKNLGRIVQRVDDEDAAHSTSTATMPTGDTAPTNTDGTELLSLSITPRSASNTILLSATVTAGCGSARDIVLTMLRGSTVIMAAKVLLSGGVETVCFEAEDAPATTSATTYSLRAGVTAAATWSFNGDGSSRVLGGKVVSSLSAVEYAA